MKRKDNKGIINPSEYWDSKLKINHYTERIRYKKLCGNKLSLKEQRQLDGAYYITFFDWEQYFNEKLDVLNVEELREYSKYTKYNVERQYMGGKMIFSVLVPYVISVIIPCLTEMCFSKIQSTYGAVLLDAISELCKWIILLIGSVILIVYLLNEAKGIAADKLFYQDIYELVITKIDEKKTINAHD